MIGPFTPANVTEAIAVELWNRRATDETITRLVTLRDKFKTEGDKHEEYWQWALGILEYVIGDDKDDPTADWITKQTS